MAELADALIESFNSTLVQLKDNEKCTIELKKRRFQFYLSSIKSNAEGITNIHYYCFNSTLVQLKADSRLKSN